MLLTDKLFKKDGTEESAKKPCGKFSKIRGTDVSRSYSKIAKKTNSGKLLLLNIKDISQKDKEQCPLEQLLTQDTLKPREISKSETGCHNGRRISQDSAETLPLSPNNLY